MPWGFELSAEVNDAKARRKRCRHTVTVILDTHRSEAVPPYVLFTELARCDRCTAPVARSRRYGPGSDGDTGWVTLP